MTEDDSVLNGGMSFARESMSRQIPVDVLSRGRSKERHWLEYDRNVSGPVLVD